MAPRLEADDFRELENGREEFPYWEMLEGLSTLNPPLPPKGFIFDGPNERRPNACSSATIMDRVREGSFGNTSKIVWLFTIRSARTKSLLQLAAVDTVAVTAGGGGAEE